jgi:hypothetical protein
MGNSLTDNNPNITDLSDRNRPTRLAEKYAELYDNQWTDAFDVLEKIYQKEEYVIETILHILEVIKEYLSNMSEYILYIVNLPFIYHTDAFVCIGYGNIFQCINNCSTFLWTKQI